MPVQQDDRIEAEVFGSWVAASMARDPHGTIARMVRVFPDSRLRQARAVLEKQPGEPQPDPWPEPDQPGAAESCNWCGRTAPPGGLTRQYPRPASAGQWVPATAGHWEPNRKTPQAYRQAAPEPAEGVADTGPHCADEEACQQEREARIQEWRRHQYPGVYKITLAGLAALAREKEEARTVLALAQAAGYAIRGWLEVQSQISEAEDDMVELSAAQGPDLLERAVSPQFGDGWEHSMRHPHNRVHTLGFQLAQWPQYDPVPAAGAVRGVAEAAKTRAGSTRRRRRLSRLR